MIPRCAGARRSAVISMVECPPCRARGFAKARHEIANYCEALRDRGGELLQWVLTVPHVAGQPYDKVARVLRTTFRGLTTSTAYRRVAERLGIVGVVRVMETTVSAFAGWHPHFHGLTFVSRTLTDAEVGWFQSFLIAEAVPRIVRAMEREGLELTIPDVDRVITVKRCHTAGQYLTKSGLLYEAVGAPTKRSTNVHGVQHLTIQEVEYQLAMMRLRYGPAGPLDRPRDARRFARYKTLHAEYVRAMRGTHLIHVGKGLRDRINAHAA